jgi:hypothetical protein
MQNAPVKAFIITNYCGFNSLVKSDRVRRALCKVGLWLVK